MDIQSHQNHHSHQMSSKGKTPWMTYNGVDIADSQFCIDYLTSHLNCNLYEGLDNTQRSIARAFQKLTEENLYWSMCAVTFGEDLSGVSKVMPYSGLTLWVILRLLRRRIRLEMWGHGIGRHSVEEIINIGKKDMLALSTFLGNKKYFMSDEPCEVDCAIFGMLAQIYWHMDGSAHEKYMKEELQNLCSYCVRMKARFWPDWEDCITKGGTAQPTK